MGSQPIIDGIHRNLVLSSQLLHPHKFQFLSSEFCLKVFLNNFANGCFPQNYRDFVVVVAAILKYFLGIIITDSGFHSQLLLTNLDYNLR